MTVVPPMAAPSALVPWTERLAPAAPDPSLAPERLDEDLVDFARSSAAYLARRGLPPGQVVDALVRELGLPRGLARHTVLGPGEPTVLG